MSPVDLLADLNEPQRRAVQHVDGPLLVLAGAGSGKTRVITRRVAYLIQRGVAPGQILAITFTNKAAREMRQRVEQLHTPPGATICTFHSLCARLLREFSSSARVTANFTIYDRDDQLRLTKDAMARAEVSAGAFQPARVHAGISRAKNDLQTPQSYAEAAGESFYMRQVAAVYAAYEKLLADNNALDFDDLLLRMAFLLRDRTDIRELLARRYRYILIDEYQDTNRAQYILAHGVALDHGNLCVTGDPDQSIYAWRGADINNILEFEADYPDAVVIRLEENYRSTAPILKSASALIAHNRARKDKALWTRREGGGQVRIVYCDDERVEADAVARRIRQYRRDGGPYSDAAVFYRVNWLSRVMEKTLRREGIPYQIARGVEFYNRKEIRDVLGYLKLMVNPADDVACLRVINTPARGIGASTVKKLRAFAQRSGVNLLEACRRGEEAQLGPAARKRVAAFSDLIAALADDLDRGVRALVEDVLLRTGLEQSLSGGEQPDESALDNVAELITAAAEFDQAVENPALANYLHQVSLVSDVDFFEGAGGAVTLMTLHAAKGLEFPAVFIIGCEDGLLPIRREGNAHTGWSASASDIEEERRLAFVGMTRAKNELTLTSARKRTIRGRRTPQSASPFLGEMGEQFVAVEDLTTPAPRPTGRRRSGGFYAGVDDREEIDAWAQALPPEYQYLKPGCRVCHPDFGIGQIVKLSMSPPDPKATIQFEDWGPKKIYLRYAKLELLDENV